MTILDNPIISSIRRNHGLEHATLQILAQRFPYRPMAGYSFPAGFFLVGDVPTEDVRDAVAQALSRLNNGEKNLAIHPNCGTNYLVTGLVAGLLAWMAMAGARRGRDRFGRFPMVVALVVLGLFIGQPLGLLVQERITTSSDLQDLTVVDIFPIRYGRFSLHRVITHG